MLLDPQHDKVSQCFRDFMTRVSEIDALTEQGNRFLRAFRQELEFFRKSPLHKTSEVVEKIVEVHNTERMMAYVQAGYRHSSIDVQNTSTLVSCQERLSDHLKKVKQLVSELEGMTTDAIDMVEGAEESTSSYIDRYSSSDAKLQQFFSTEGDTEVAGTPKSHNEMKAMNIVYGSIVHHAIMMRIIYKMFSQDYAMQEKIVLSLSLSSSSDELESYCLMWDLRPFIDDGVMRQSWQFIH